MDAKPTLIRFVLFYLLPLVTTNGPCQDDIYLEVGKRQIVSCTFDNFEAIGWINGNSEENLPVISLQNNVKQGPGYDSGKYDINENGSLIINNVTLNNEFNYTVLHVSLQGFTSYFHIAIKTFISPVPEYPVVNGLTRDTHVVLDVSEEGFLNCSMKRIRPSVNLEWIYPSEDIIMHSTQNIEDNKDGTYNTSIVSTFSFTSGAVDRITLHCKVAGSNEVLFPLVTKVDLLLRKNLPVVNGLANQQQIVVDVSSEDELTCSMNKVPEDVSLTWVFLTPFLPYDTIVHEKPFVTDNGDQTVNITLKLKISHSNNFPYATLLCRPSSKKRDRSLHSTKVTLLFPKAPPVPVIDGCHSHQSDCSVVMLKGEKVTCSAMNVPSTFENPHLTMEADGGILSVIKSTSNQHPNGDYDIISSYHYSVGEQSVIQIRCLLTGSKNNSQFELTATAQIILEEAYQSSGGTTALVIILLLLSIGLNIGLYFKRIWPYIKQRRKKCRMQGRC